jgi:hypothetical protein
MHPAFQECIRRLYLLPTKLSMTAIHEHTEMQQVATRLTSETGKPVKLPSYAQVRKQVQHLSMEPELVAMREGAKSVPRERESAESFALSIPAPALLTEGSMSTPWTCTSSLLLVKQWPAVCMQQCLSVSKRRRSLAQSWLWGHGKRRGLYAPGKGLYGEERSPGRDQWL